MRTGDQLGVGEPIQDVEAEEALMGALLLTLEPGPLRKKVQERFFTHGRYGFLGWVFLEWRRSQDAGISWKGLLKRLLAQKQVARKFGVRNLGYALGCLIERGNPREVDRLVPYLAKLAVCRKNQECAEKQWLRARQESVEIQEHYHGRRTASVS